MDGLFYTFTVFVFAAVILMVEGAYLWWAGTHGGASQRVARRLQLMSAGQGRASERISILKQRRFSRHDATDRILHRIRLAHKIDRLLVQSGSKWSVAQYLCWSLALLLGGACLVLPWPAPWAARCAVMLLLLSLPYMMVRRRRTRRLHKIEEQLPEAADFLARAMRAGHSFTNVLQMVGHELPEPLSGEFRTAHEEINYGVPMNEALHNMAARIPLTDLRYLVIAVLIQR